MIPSREDFILDIRNSEVYDSVEYRAFESVCSRGWFADLGSGRTAYVVKRDSAYVGASLKARGGRCL